VFTALGVGDVVFIADGSNSPYFVTGSSLDRVFFSQFASVVPRAGTLTSLYIDTTTLLSVIPDVGTTTMTYTLYLQTPAGSGTAYTPTALSVSLPLSTLPLAVVTDGFGASFASVPVVAGDRVVLVASMSPPSALAAAAISELSISGGVLFL